MEKSPCITKCKCFILIGYLYSGSPGAKSKSENIVIGTSENNPVHVMFIGQRKEDSFSNF